MAEFIQLTTGEFVAVDRDANGYDHQWVKLTLGDEDEFAPLTLSNPMPIGVPRSSIVTNTVTLTASVAETTIITGVTGFYHDITSILVGNSSPTLAVVSFRDATGGTIRHNQVAAANGGGGNAPLPVRLPQSATGANWTVQSSASVSSLYITVIAVAYPG